MISIIIPTYNNLDYLKLCINSLNNNSKHNHELIFHINDGSDGTTEFIKNNGYKFTHSESNIGLCSSVNKAAKLATFDYILYCHDDMYFCPDWDVVLINEIKSINHEKFYLSGTMIETNSGHIKFDCGSDYKNFNEQKLLDNYKELKCDDFQGSHWAPHLIHKETWNKISGLSEEFNPGIGSDPDLNMKLWNEGVRIFKGLSKFKVYHFGSVSLRKKPNLKRNRGDKTFLKKWGITIKFFKKYYLKSGTKYLRPLPEPNKNFNYYIYLFSCKIKYLFTF